MEAMQIARSEMLKVIARQRIATALRMNVPAVAYHDMAIISDLLLYKERPRNECIGPYNVLASNNKNLLLSVKGSQFLSQSRKSSHTRTHITPIYRTGHSEISTLKWLE